MKKRNLAAVFLFSIITLGIYDIVWLVKTKKELNAKTKIHTPTIWLLFLPLMLFIAATIILIVTENHALSSPAAFNATGNAYTGQTTTAAANIVGLLVSLLAFIIIIPVTFFWFFRFSKAINEYTNGKMSTGVTFMLLWIVHFIGVILVQDTFNDMIDAGTVPGNLVQDTPGPAMPQALNSPMAPAQPVNMPTVPPVGPAPQASFSPAPQPTPTTPANFNAEPAASDPVQPQQFVPHLGPVETATPAPAIQTTDQAVAPPTPPENNNETPKVQ